jgi:hypothetical protein
MPFDVLKSDILKLKQGGFNTIIGDAIRKNAGLILKMNTQDQLYNQGIDKFGVKLKEYRPKTKSYKVSVGEKPDVTTLKDTGQFYSNYFININFDSFEIDSDDVKREELFQKYGSGIFGLTDENMRILGNILKIELLQQIRKQL